jgi:hypothetical protein
MIYHRRHQRQQQQQQQQQKARSSITTTSIMSQQLSTSLMTLTFVTIIVIVLQHHVIQPVSSLVYTFTGDEEELGFSLEDWEIHEFGDGDGNEKQQNNEKCRSICTLII